jgi:hypothetical protein
MYPRCDYTLLWSVQPLLLLSLTPSLPTPFFNSFQYISFIFSAFADIVFYNIVDTLSLFPSSRVFPLLQTCSTSEFVYNHTCFCICVYLWIYLPHMRENIQPLSFWAWLTSLNTMSSNCIHLPSNHMLTSFFVCFSIGCVSGVTPCYPCSGVSMPVTSPPLSTKPSFLVLSHVKAYVRLEANSPLLFGSNIFTL